MNIQTPIATWILSRLFNENLPVSEKDLVRTLCQASFASMTDDNDFDTTMKELIDSEYIEHSDEEITEHVPIPSANLYSSQKMQEVKKTYSGYVITKKGIIAFRRQIVTPIEKILPELSRLPTPRIEKFKGVMDSLKSNADILTTSIKLCIDNAPLILDFIKTSIHELSLIGVPIS